VPVSAAVRGRFSLLGVVALAYLSAVIAANAAALDAYRIAFEPGMTAAPTRSTTSALGLLAHAERDLSEDQR
jgi:hypothetical protein